MKDQEMKERRRGYKRGHSNKKKKKREGVLFVVVGVCVLDWVMG